MTTGKSKGSARAEEMRRGRESLARHFAEQHRATTDALEAALEAALPRLGQATGEETLYAVALYTSGERDIAYVHLSANTEEGLTRTAHRYVERSPGSTIDAQRASLRWSAPDWAYHSFDHLEPVHVRPSPLPSSAYDRAVWNALAEALERLDARGAFGSGADRDRVALAILCGDMSARFFGKGVRRLNPAPVARRCLREWRAGA